MHKKESKNIQSTNKKKKLDNWSTLFRYIHSISHLEHIQEPSFQCILRYQTIDINWTFKTSLLIIIAKLWKVLLYSRTRHQRVPNINHKTVSNISFHKALHCCVYIINWDNFNLRRNVVFGCKIYHLLCLFHSPNTSSTYYFPSCYISSSIKSH